MEEPYDSRQQEGGEHERGEMLDELSTDELISLQIADSRAEQDPDWHVRAYEPETC